MVPWTKPLDGLVWGPGGGRLVVCSYSWRLCVCIVGMLGDEVGSLLLSRWTHCLGTFDPFPCWGNYTRLAQVNPPQ